MLRLPVLLFMLFTGLAFAQEEEIVDPKLQVQLMPLFQDWSADSVGDVRDFSEISTALSAYIPISENASVSLWLAQANIRFGDEDSLNNKSIRDLSGITDLQMGATYYLESFQTVASLKLNIPIGKKELNRREFDTSAIIANGLYRFQVPNLGQGFNVAPGLTWAHQVNNKVAIGLGTSYNYRGSYKALDVVDKFNPGDEFLLTGGFDVRVDDASTVTSDLIFMTYTRDKIGSEEIFAAGNRYIWTTQYHRYFDFNELQVVARFRSQGKSEVFLLERQNNIIPTNFHLFANYAWLLNPAFTMGFFLEGRFYGKASEAKVPFSDGKLFGFGFYPEVIVNERVRLPIRIKYMIADFKNNISLNGLDLGMGLELTF